MVAIICQRQPKETNTELRGKNMKTHSLLVIPEHNSEAKDALFAKYGTSSIVCNWVVAICNKWVQDANLPRRTIRWSYWSKPAHPLTQPMVCPEQREESQLYRSLVLDFAWFFSTNFCQHFFQVQLRLAFKSHLFQCQELGQCLGIVVQKSKPTFEQLTSLFSRRFSPRCESLRSNCDCLRDKILTILITVLNAVKHSACSNFT